MDEKEKKVLEAIKEAGFEVKMDGGDITIAAKDSGPLSKEECKKVFLIMQNYGYSGHFRHPDPCIIVTNSRGVIMEFGGDLIAFSSQDAFYRFKRNFCPEGTRLFPHSLKWETILEKLADDYKGAILDFEGKLGPEVVYNHILLIKPTEIGGMA